MGRRKFLIRELLDSSIILTVYSEEHNYANKIANNLNYKKSNFVKKVTL